MELLLNKTGCSSKHCAKNSFLDIPAISSSKLSKLAGSSREARRRDILWLGIVYSSPTFFLYIRRAQASRLHKEDGGNKANGGFLLW